MPSSPIWQPWCGMTLSFDLFWSFRSPYSYLATPRLVEMERDYDLDDQCASRLSAGGALGRFLRAGQSAVDSLSDARHLSPRRRCSACPIAGRGPIRSSSIRPRAPATPNQPYIHRLTRLGCAAAETGRGLPFLNEVSRADLVRRSRWLARRRSSGEGRGARRARSRGTRCEDRRRSRQIRSDHPGQPESASGRPAIGACRPWRSRASRSSGRTGSTCCCGG